jgi:Zn-dependent membrane protease YugP
MGIGLIGSSILVKSMHMAWQNVLFIVAAILVVMLVCLPWSFVASLKSRAAVNKKAPRRQQVEGEKRAAVLAAAVQRLLSLFLHLLRLLPDRHLAAFLSPDRTRL